MILSGSIDDAHVARSAAATRDTAEEARIDATRRSAEHAIDALLASWRDDTGGLDSAHHWEASATDAIDALSALLASLDLARSERLLIRQRSGS